MRMNAFLFTLDYCNGTNQTLFISAE